MESSMGREFVTSGFGERSAEGKIWSSWIPRLPVFGSFASAWDNTHTGGLKPADEISDVLVRVGVFEEVVVRWIVEVVWCVLVGEENGDEWEVEKV
jgi:hypothetical protein